MIVKVAVAIITNEQQEILVAQRPLHVPHGGRWEFPGGKLEANELAEEALVREIREEVNLEILQYDYLGDVNYDYQDKSVQLIVFHVTEFSGIPICREGQLNLKWVSKDQLRAEDFPEANQGIFELIPVLETIS